MATTHTKFAHSHRLRQQYVKIITWQPLGVALLRLVLFHSLSRTQNVHTVAWDIYIQTSFSLLTADVWMNIWRVSVRERQWKHCCAAAIACLHILITLYYKHSLTLYALFSHFHHARAHTYTETAEAERMRRRRCRCFCKKIFIIKTCTRRLCDASTFC